MKAMKKPRVVIYNHPNSEIKSFLTPKEISAYKVECFRSPLKEDADENVRSLGLIGERVVREIMAINGVEEIYIKPKEVRMKKNPSISWQEIEEKIVTILNRALKRREIRIITKEKSTTRP